jgi:hypothetical protein
MKWKNVGKFLFSLFSIANASQSSSSPESLRSLTYPFCKKQGEGRFVCGAVDFDKIFQLDAGSLDSAKRILIGEAHGYRKVVNAFLHQFENDDIQQQVLAEFPAEKDINCEKVDISSRQNRICRGWDIKDVHKEVWQRFPKIAMLSNLVNRIKSGRGEQQLDQFVKNYLDEIKEYRYKKKESIIENKAKIDEAQDMCEKILAKRKNKHKSYNQIIQELKSEISYKDKDEFNKLVGNNDLKRGESLVRAIRASQSEQTIVIAGAAHLTTNIEKTGFFGASYLKEQQGDAAAVRYLKKELEKDKDQNPYAILVMDEIEAKKAISILP